MRRIGVAQRSQVVAILRGEPGDWFSLRGVNYYWDEGYMQGGRDNAYVLNPIDNCLIVLSDGRTICCREDQLQDALAHLPEVS